MRLFFVFSVLFLFITFVNAQNPIVPAGIYIADSSAHCIFMAHATHSGTISFGTDNLWNWPALATIEVPGNGGGKTWQNITVKVAKIQGVHSMWLRFYGEGTDLFKMDWFQFEK